MLLELLSIFTTTPFAGPTTPPQPISVQVMSESLCIDCQRFFQKSLIPTYRSLGPSVMDLQVIPFGNSRIDYDRQTVTCQHGEAECDANTWQQCAVDQTPPEFYMDFFDCLENVLPMGHRDEPFDESVFRQCAVDSTIGSPSKLRGNAMDYGKLKACHDDPTMAWSLQVKYAKKTPPHNFVPWVLVDHQFVDVDKQDLFQEVCQAFQAKGGMHPACASYRVVRDEFGSESSDVLVNQGDVGPEWNEPDVVDTAVDDLGPAFNDEDTTIDEESTDVVIDSIVEKRNNEVEHKVAPKIVDDKKPLSDDDDGSSLLYQDVDGGSSFFFFFSKSGPRFHGQHSPPPS